MLVTRRDISQDSGCRELVRLVPVVNQLLTPQVCRVGDVDWLFWARQWRSIEDERLHQDAAEDGVHHILSLQEITLIVQLIASIFVQVPHRIYSV